MFIIIHIPTDTVTLNHTPKPHPQGHGQGAESRTERQKKELEKKLQKTRQQLLQEKEHIQVAQNSYLQGLETTQSGKAQQR